MLHGEALNTWHRQGTKKTGNTYNQHKRSPTQHRAPSKGEPKCFITPTSTAAMHASITATSCHNHAHPAGSLSDPLGRSSPVKRNTGRLSRNTKQTPPAPAGTCCAPRPGGPGIRRNFLFELVESQERTASRFGREGGDGGMKEEGARRRRGSGADERTGGGARERVLGGGEGVGG